MEPDGGALRCGYLCTECDQYAPGTKTPLAAIGGSFECEQGMSASNVLTGTWSQSAYKGTTCTFKGGFHVGGLSGGTCK